MKRRKKVKILRIQIPRLSMVQKMVRTTSMDLMTRQTMKKNLVR